jgi:hypothetical protein
MLLSRLCALALVSGLAACAHSERPTTPTFESKMPPLDSELDKLGDGAASRDACADLAGAASLTFAETPDGAAIDLTPRAGHRSADVEDAATRVEETFLPGVHDDERASCRIFDRGAEVNVHISRDVGSGAIRLVFETFDPKAAVKVRERVKAFVTEKSP